MLSWFIHYIMEESMKWFIDECASGKTTNIHYKKHVIESHNFSRGLLKFITKNIYYRVLVTLRYGNYRLDQVCKVPIHYYFSFVKWSEFGEQKHSYCKTREKGQNGNLPL